MKEKVEQLKAEIEQFKIDSAEAMEKFRIAFLGSKGAIKDLFADLKQVPNEERRKKKRRRRNNKLESILRTPTVIQNMINIQIGTWRLTDLYPLRVRRCRSNCS